MMQSGQARSIFPVSTPFRSDFLHEFHRIHDAVGTGPEHLPGLHPFQVLADGAFVSRLEFLHDLTGELVGRLFAVGGVQVGGAVDESRQDAGAGDGAAGALHAAHAESKAFAGPEQDFLVHIHLVGKGAGYRLCAVVSFIVQCIRFFFSGFHDEPPYHTVFSSIIHEIRTNATVSFGISPPFSQGRKCVRIPSIFFKGRSLCLTPPED